MTKKYAFVFPGQGSQSLGMLSDFAEEPIVLETFQEASESLGYDLWRLTQDGPVEKLNQTQYTQPALLTAGFALWRLFQSQRPIPKMLAGHSLGEYTALVCAGALDFLDGVHLVSERGRLMQSAVPEGWGAMAAILGLSDEAVQTVCQSVCQEASAKAGTDAGAGKEVVEPANYNSVGQVVIAGHREAVTRAMEKAKEHGARRVILLPVSVPSHCALMKPIVEEYEKLLASISLKKPSIPVIHNVDVAEHEEPESIRRVLREQLYSPVRWVETIQSMAELGIHSILECGPGTVLTGLNKRIQPSLSCASITSGEAVCL